MQDRRRDVRVAYDDTPALLSVAAVRLAVRTVLDAEDAGPAEFDITFVSPEQMQALNRERFARDRTTDVIAFSLPHPGVLVGDVYICPAVAHETARDRGAPDEEEALRLVIHGTLHVLGYDHPEGAERTLSLMWRLQERYVRQLARAR
jgi:probable rRNA maturation factor